MVEKTRTGRRSLNMAMNDTDTSGWTDAGARQPHHRRQHQRRLQNGTAFFASTSLIAIGGALTLLRITDDVMNLFADLPFGLATTRVPGRSRRSASR